MVGLVTGLLLLGLAVGGLAVFRYQQVACLAREGARWASVHGTQYHRDTGRPTATTQDIYTNAILPVAFGMNPNQLSYSVNINNSPWTTTNCSPYHLDDQGGGVIRTITNNVTVTVTCQWQAIGFLPAITMTSSSTVPMME